MWDVSSGEAETNTINITNILNGDNDHKLFKEKIKQTYLGFFSAFDKFLPLKSFSCLLKEIFDTHFARGKSKVELLLVLREEPKISNTQLLTILTNALQFNLFIPCFLLIPLKTLENLGFLMLSGGSKRKIGKKWVNILSSHLIAL